MPSPSRSTRRTSPATSRTLAPFLALVTLSADDGDQRSSAVQLFKVGKYWDERYGNFKIDETDLSQMVANFGTPAIVPVDFNHGTSRPTSPEAGKAAGRIVSLELRAEGRELWGQVEWTEYAASKIEAKEYLAMSPTFRYNYKHSDGRALGTTLLAAALTNRPVLDGMAEIAASQLFLEGLGALELADGDDAPTSAIFSYDEQRRRVQAALSEVYGLGSPTVHGPCCGVYIVDLFDGRVIFYRWVESGTSTHLSVSFELTEDGAVRFTSEPVEVVNAWKALDSTEEQTMSKNLTTVKDAAGKDVQLSADVIASIQAAAQPAPAAQTIDLAKFAEMETTLASQGTTITELSNRNAALELSAKTTKATADVDALVRAGKVLPVEKDDLIKLAVDNPTAFELATKHRPVIVTLGAAQGVESDRQLSGTTSDELQLAINAETTANPKLTQEQAYALALEKNPRLYELSGTRQ
jgi:phage I-like protein